nr:MAG TPA: hypothetical protein [Bacteriophage sp.]
MAAKETELNEDFQKAVEIYNLGYNTENFKLLNNSTISTYGYNPDSNIGKKGTKIINVIPGFKDDHGIYTVEVFELAVRNHRFTTGDKVKSFEISTPDEIGADVLLNIKTLKHYIITPDTFYYLNLLSNLDKAAKEPRRINTLDDLDRVGLPFGMPIDSDGNDGIKFFIPTNNI